MVCTSFWKSRVGKVILKCSFFFNHGYLLFDCNSAGRSSTVYVVLKICFNKDNTLLWGPEKGFGFFCEKLGSNCYQRACQFQHLLSFSSLQRELKKPSIGWVVGTSDCKVQRSLVDCYALQHQIRQIHLISAAMVLAHLLAAGGTTSPGPVLPPSSSTSSSNSTTISTLVSEILQMHLNEIFFTKNTSKQTQNVTILPLSVS